MNWTLIAAMVIAISVGLTRAPGPDRKPNFAPCFRKRVLILPSVIGFLRILNGEDVCKGAFLEGSVSSGDNDIHSPWIPVRFRGGGGSDQWRIGGKPNLVFKICHVPPNRRKR